MHLQGERPQGAATASQGPAGRGRQPGPRAWFALSLALAAAGLGCRASGEGAPLVVSAAMSLSDVLPPLAQRFEDEAGVRLALNFDGSAMLARQIEAGAPVDLFLPADERTLDALGARVATRRVWAEGRLVVVAPKGQAPPADWRARPELVVALGAAPLPAGRYARAWLEATGGLAGGEARVVAGDHVRAVLAAVGAGAAAVGVVYEADLVAGAGAIEVVERLEGPGVPAVRYAGGVLAGSSHQGGAQAFLEFLASPAAAEALRAGGLSPAPRVEGR